jgi:hypothetical protein
MLVEALVQDRGLRGHGNWEPCVRQITVPGEVVTRKRGCSRWEDQHVSSSARGVA